MSSLQELIRQGEGERVEFKKKTTHPTRIARTLVSLANTRGGHVLVGVDDDGRVVGVRDAEEEMYVLRDAAAHYVDPPIILTFKEVEDPPSGRREEVRLEISHYIAYYNAERRHSALGYLAPNRFEFQFQTMSQLCPA